MRLKDCRALTEASCATRFPTDGRIGFGRLFLGHEISSPHKREHQSPRNYLKNKFRIPLGTEKSAPAGDRVGASAANVAASASGSGF